MEDTNASRLRWAADRIDGVLTLVEVDGDTGRGAIVELGDGVVRIQLGEILDGRFVVRHEAQVEAVCTVEAVAEAGPVPFADAMPMPGPRKVRKSAADHGDREAA